LELFSLERKGRPVAGWPFHFAVSSSAMRLPNSRMNREFIAINDFKRAQRKMKTFETRRNGVSRGHLRCVAAQSPVVVSKPWTELECPGQSGNLRGAARQGCYLKSNSLQRINPINQSLWGHAVREESSSTAKTLMDGTAEEKKLIAGCTDLEITRVQECRKQKILNRSMSPDLLPCCGAVVGERA
jgi:hypothetical protein